MGKNHDKYSIRTTVGENLKRLREKAGLSQAELAELADLSKNFISYIENGIYGISDKTLAGLSNALGVEPFQFYTTESSLGNPQDEVYIKIFRTLKDEIENFLEARLDQIIKEKEEKSRKDKNE